MPNPNRVNDPHHWCERAAAMRALAETMANVETTAVMLKLADDYDKLTDRAGQRQTRKAEKESSPRLR